jgi:hypothetical protein
MHDVVKQNQHRLQRGGDVGQRGGVEHLVDVDALVRLNDAEIDELDFRPGTRIELLPGYLPICQNE